MIAEVEVLKRQLGTMKSLLDHNETEKLNAIEILEEKLEMQ